jgi:glycosyltransferase involved in cell wall biosynthesis
MHKNVVLMPTYNEANSIQALLQNLGKSNVDVIVIDDDSPDGTAKIIGHMGLDYVKVINHGKKRGIGPAYITGMNIAIAAGYEKIATMDADGSHLSNDLEKMFASAQDIDVVMGTRWMPGGAVSNWGIQRRYLSKFGTRYARRCLALPYRDLTGGMRVYDAKKLEDLNLQRIRSNGYCFQIEMIKALHSLEAQIIEVPIHFVERREGVSKMSKGIVFEAFSRVSLWGFQRLLRINADKLHYVK